MPTAHLPDLDRYRTHLAATLEWLVRSVEHGRGGSCAHFAPLLGWSRPYPETTGYLVPTLLALDARFPERQLDRIAIGLGEWLLSIQNADGSWNGGLHPPRGSGAPSVFNTGQILKGMAALYHHGGDARWLEAGARGARWLADGVGADGLWPGSDYRATQTPSYYTHVSWPMLEMWSLDGDDRVRAAAVGVLDTIAARRLENGAFPGWGFTDEAPAFTHTIAYTIRGFLESARLLDEWQRYGELVVPALEVLLERSEAAGGRLPGAFDIAWRKAGNSICLTGNAQVAICILLWEERVHDSQRLSAAARMVDFVCSRQSLSHPIRGVRGAVAGSAPVWGPYMRGRYPNWAAKYHCDALLRLDRRLRRDREANDSAGSNGGP